MTTRSDYAFFHQFRIRYSEVDAQGIVFNAHYLTFFDQAITEFTRELDYKALIKDRGIEFHLVKATVDYKRPIHTDALIDVGVSVARVGTSSMTWSLAIFPSGSDELLSLGEVIWVASLRGQHKSIPIPADFVAVLRQQRAA